MPTIEIELPETTRAVRAALARAVTAAFCDATGHDRATLDVYFHSWGSGDAARAGELLDAEGPRAVHVSVSSPRLARPAKQALARGLTEAIRGVTGWVERPVVHLSEHPYDNVVVEGALLSDAFEACRSRPFYYPTEPAPGERVRVSSGAPWEPLVGYSRAVRVGESIAVTGTTATTRDGHVGDGDAYAQTIQALRNIEVALVAAGSSLLDVVRTRIFVRDIARDWEAIGRGHAELLGQVRPATSMVEVSRLIADWMLVEIEADAVAGSSAIVREVTTTR